MDKDTERRKKYLFVSVVSIILLVALVMGIVALVIVSSLKSDDRFTLREGNYYLQKVEDGQECPFDGFTLSVVSVDLQEDMVGEKPVRLGVELTEGEIKSIAEVKVKEYAQNLLTLTLSTSGGEYEFSGELKGSGGVVSEIAVTLKGAEKSYAFTLIYQN